MNKRFISFLPLLIISIVLVFLGIKIYWNLEKLNPESEIKSVLVGKKAPQIKTQNFFKNNKKFIIDNNIQGPYLVNFFSSWCIPCQYEAPFLENLSKKIAVYGIVYKDTFVENTKFLEKFGNPYNNIGVDNDGLIAIDWGVYGVPETFLINSNNKIVFRHAGPITDEVLNYKINPELRKLGL